MKWCSSWKEQREVLNCFIGFVSPYGEFVFFSRPVLLFFFFPGSCHFTVFWTVFENGTFLFRFTEVG